MSTTSIIKIESSEFKLKINEFEGPLDLILFLICKNKMNIFELNLSEITDKYLEYLDGMSKFNMDIASEFIVMASTLVNIKSRKLLPEITDNDDEEEISEEEMIARILEYKKYKEVSNIIALNYQNGFGTFLKPMEKIRFIKQIEYSGDKFKSKDLNKIYLEILARNENKINIKAKEIEKIAIHEKVTVKEKAAEIINYLAIKDKFVFNKYFDNNKFNNTHIVTGFLSVLELNKLKKIKLEQEYQFGDINVSKNENFNMKNKENLNQGIFE